MDIATFWSPPDGRGDWLQSGPLLVSGHDLETSVLISLFTDRRADPDDAIADGSGDPRGWWGDLYEPTPIGSKLWLLDRAKKTEATRQRAQDYIEDALAWLVDDGIAAAVRVTVQWQAQLQGSGADPSRGFLAAAIEVDEPSGRGVVFNYQWAWGTVASGSGS